MKRTLVLLFLAVLVLQAHAQKEGYVWYFGSHAGLDFSTNPPTSLAGSAMDQYEGCASIADGSGQLLFYTDGDTIWNKNHVIMSNGTGLFGNYSTTQSAIIVKQPGNQNLYYVFTQDAIVGQYGLRYSVVDMALAAGMGSVTTKNIALEDSCTEKITAAMHCNGTDIWILTHQAWNNRFKSFLLTSAGINTVAVTSHAGSYHSGFLGQMKLSPNGSKLGMAIYQNVPDTAFEIYDFSRSTGMVSNPITLQVGALLAYGCEFSPDGTKFYGGTYNSNQYFQWDLCAGSPSAIVAGVTTWSVPTEAPGSFQLAPNGKIYISNPGKQYLSTINNPNLSGTSCGLQIFSYPLANGFCKFGLPNFLNSYFGQPPPPFTLSVSCLTSTLTPPPFISLNQGGCFSALGLNGFKWIVSNGALPPVTYTVMSPIHTFPGPGTYTVKLALDYLCGKDTITVPVAITNTLPTIGVVGTFTACQGTSTTFTATGANSYYWSTNQIGTSVSIPHQTTTVYAVTGTDLNNCTNSTTFSVTVMKAPTLNVAGTFTACPGDRVTFTVTGASTYTWSNSLSTQTVSLLVPATMVYSVSGTDSLGCSSSKSFSVFATGCSGMGEESSGDFNVFPNPVNDRLTLRTSRHGTLKIVNCLGETVLTQETDPGDAGVDMSGFQPGVFILLFDDGTRARMTRIVKSP